MNQRPPLSLFTGFGVELEYMIVSADSLSVLPITDQVLKAVAGSFESEVDLGDISWSNELALHVIELKTNGPADSLSPLPARFQEHVGRIHQLLEPLNARLMPTAMHPWMHPERELKLWPHDFNAVYEAFNRIFDCRGHGWSNLQSVHLNLPFADDEEFGRLHAAIRLVLPLLPALAASSPVVEGRSSGLCDTRLNFYRGNAKAIPSITGQVIPEPVYARRDYEQQIFRQMYADIAPHDPDGILQFEWLNARGAIARFDRSTIEIRLIDVQECPLADVAICAATVAVLKALIAERFTSYEQQQAMPTETLSQILLAAIRDADQTRVDDAAFLRHFGITSAAGIAAGDVWRHVVDQLPLPEDASEASLRGALGRILQQGPLARRIISAVGTNPASERLAAVYRSLCDCLRQGTMFHADG